MADDPVRYVLPGKLERYLGALSKLYAQEGERSLQTIIVNAQVQVMEGWHFDNWDGGQVGHAVSLIIPQNIYLANLGQRDHLQQRISQDINKLHNIPNEYIHDVFLEMELLEEGDWRQESGLLIANTRLVAPEAAKRLWAEGNFRVFLSHKTEVKREAATLKDALRFYGISAFVAHEDIHPTKEWQDEIENALSTMDGFVALLSSGFHESLWTDQEVGYALARGVPIIAVRLERDPYGFLGKFQALSCGWAGAPQEITKLLIRQDRMLSAYIRALGKCSNFDEGNMLSKILPSIETMTQLQVDEVVDVFNRNGELQGSFGFNGTKPASWGQGLLPHLHRWGARRYRMTGTYPRRIEISA